MQLVSGGQTITVTVGREPARGGIDPYRRLIEHERHDNVFKLRRMDERPD